MNIILLGSPGSGKGTQAKILMEKYNVAHLSTGDMLRSAVKVGDAFGKDIEAKIKEGLLISDAIVEKLIADSINNLPAGKGFILDGYPRNLVQAEGLTKLFLDKNIKLDAVIEIRVDEDILFSRIESRVKDAQSTGQVARLDDSVEVLEKRLAEYRSKTAPVAAYYNNLGKLDVVDGMLTIPEVTAAIEAKIQKRCK
ncbi:adenylate kinase [Bartonella sp. DGB1]|uniref:adenylate kinase n=1 Tax=Bartonella sp. DGB1 TaxID=3239807 RepID=UPI0035259718